MKHNTGNSYPDLSASCFLFLVPRTRTCWLKQWVKHCSLSWKVAVAVAHTGERLMSCESFQVWKCLLLAVCGSSTVPWLEQKNLISCAKFACSFFFFSGCCLNGPGTTLAMQFELKERRRSNKIEPCGAEIGSVCGQLLDLKGKMAALATLFNHQLKRRPLLRM